MQTIQRADPAARRRAVLVILIAMALGALAYFGVDAWLADVRTREPAAARRALGDALLWAAIVNCAVLAGFGAYGWRLGRRIVGSLRFPPPGLAVVRDTPVVEGHRARVRGRMLQGLAACLVLLALASLVVGVWLVARLS